MEDHPVFPKNVCKNLLYFEDTRSHKSKNRQNNEQKKQTIDKTLNRKLRLSNINSHTTSVRSLHFTTHMLFYSNFLAADTKDTQTNWSHRYRNSTVVITIWLTITKYPYLNWQWIFSFLPRVYLSSITDKTFIGLDYTCEQNGGYLKRSRNCLPFASTWVHRRFLWAPCCSSL